MSDGTFDPTRPVWDKSLPGVLPENLADAIAPSAKLAGEQETMVEEILSLSPNEMLDRLDKIQAQANMMANSAGASLMTHEQDFIYGWQRQKTVAETSLEAFENPDYLVEDREYKVETCKRNLATALYKLGRFEQALMIAGPFTDLADHIRWVREAIERPDPELHEHACQRPVETMESHGKTVEIELDRRWATEEVLSPNHGSLAHVWVCSQCGVANGTPEIPIRQQRYEGIRQQIQQAIKQGEGLRAFEADLVLGKTV